MAILRHLRVIKGNIDGEVRMALGIFYSVSCEDFDHERDFSAISMEAWNCLRSGGQRKEQPTVFNRKIFDSLMHLP
jgi:hypothetical protein